MLLRSRASRVSTQLDPVEVSELTLYRRSGTGHRHCAASTPDLQPKAVCSIWGTRIPGCGSVRWKVSSYRFSLLKTHHSAGSLAMISGYLVRAYEHPMTATRDLTRLWLSYLNQSLRPDQSIWILLGSAFFKHSRKPLIAETEVFYISFAHLDAPYTSEPRNWQTIYCNLQCMMKAGLCGVRFCTDGRRKH